jgi:putative copper resistance protein D
MATVLDSWHLDPVMVVVVVAAAIGYLTGVSRIRRAGGRWPLRRTLGFFCVALPSLVFVTMGWPDVYGRVLFSIYAVQLTVLLMVVPFLCALGRPVTLAKAALSEPGRARLESVLASRAAKFFTVPVVSPLLLAVVPIVVYFTPLYRQSLAQPALLPLLHLLFLLIGLAVLVPLWEADTINARFPYAVALLFAFIELLMDAIPGIVIRLDTHPIAVAYFTGLGRPWGPSALSDQRLGGDLLWCIGEAVDVPFLALLVLQWVRSDARDAARIDRALDEARRPATGPDGTATGPEGVPGGNERPDDEALDRPWWESDASVFGDRAGSYQRRDD